MGVIAKGYNVAVLVVPIDMNSVQNGFENYRVVSRVGSEVNRYR